MSEGIRIYVSERDEPNKWIRLPNIPEADLHHGPKDDPPKKRKLGIRFRKQQAREWGWTVPSAEAVEIFDIESGEAIEGVWDIQVRFTGQQVVAELKIFAAAVDSYEREEISQGSRIDDHATETGTDLKENS